MLTELLGAALGGFFAGVLALSVGGVGVLLQLRRQVGLLAQAVDDVQERVTHEVKSRAGQAGGRRSQGEIEALEAFARATASQPRGDGRLSRREILARAPKEP